VDQERHTGAAGVHAGPVAVGVLHLVGVKSELTGECRGERFGPPDERYSRGLGARDSHSRDRRDFAEYVGEGAIGECDPSELPEGVHVHLPLRVKASDKRPGR
jgi:hypothetical protein